MKQSVKYKHSGITWIGEVPHDWKVKRLKYCFEFHQGGSWGEEPKEDENDYICIRVADFNYQRLCIGSKKYTIRNYKDSQIQKLLLKKGDLLIEKSGGGDNSPVGRVVVFNKEFKALYANFLEALRVKPNENSQFYNYIFASLYSKGINKKYFNQTTGIQNLNITDYLNEAYPIPSIETQQSISEYLDRKTTAIDTLIADKQKLVELLREKRNAIISEAATKGLDKNAPMKDSGVDWIGKIPEGWEIAPLFSIAKENRVKNIGNACINLLSLSYGNIIKKDINTNEGLLPESFENYQVVEESYTVLRLTDLQNDKRSLRSGYVREEGIITSAYVGLIPSVKMNGLFLSKILHGYDLMKIFYALGNGVRQSMNFRDLKRLPIVVPPIEQQREISKYLDKKVTQIDALITEITEQIDKLQEYRQAVISEAVTGKVAI